jgi:spore germination protein KC
LKRWMRIWILLLPLVTAGCWDRKEINDIGFVIGTGLDLAKNGNMQATLQVAVPSPSTQTGGGTKDTDKFIVISAVGKNTTELEQKLQQKMSRKLYFSHRSIILVGESLARKGIGDTLDRFSRNPRSRLRTYVLVVKGMTAGDMLRVVYPYEMTSSEAVKEMELMKTSGVSTPLKDFMLATASEGIHPAVGVLEPTEFFRTSLKGEDTEFRLNETAVFNRFKLAGFLNRTETHEFLWFRNSKKGDQISANLPGGKGNVGLTVKKSKIKIDVVPKGERYKLLVHIKAGGDLLENNTKLDVTQAKNIAIIEKALENQVEHDIKLLLRKIQRYRSDIIGFGSLLERKQPQMWRKVGKQWDMYFSAAEVSVSVELNIDNTGLIGPSLQLKEKEIIK